MPTMKGEKMYLLRDLWYGNVTPGERFGRRGSEYMKLTEEANEMMERLIAELTPEGAKLLEELLDKQIVLIKKSITPLRRYSKSTFFGSPGFTDRDGLVSSIS